MNPALKNPVAAIVTECPVKAKPRFASWSLAFALLAFVALTASAEISTAQDLSGDLLSEITMSDTVVSAAPAKTTEPKLVLGAVSLSEVFAKDQIPCEISSQTVLVALSDLAVAESESDRMGRLRLDVDADADRIDVVLPLPQITVEAVIDGAKWMQLLNRLSNRSNVQLIASAQKLALRSSLSNRDVTTDRIRSVAQRLADAATDSLPLLATLQNKQSAVVAATPTGVSPSSASNDPSNSITETQPASIEGTWSANTSATDAWAIRFGDDGGFVMVHTSGGKNAVSRGQFRATKNQLTLNETSGVTLSGILDRTAENAFRWKLTDTAGNVTTTLAFVKQ